MRAASGLGLPRPTRRYILSGRCPLPLSLKTCAALGPQHQPPRGGQAPTRGAPSPRRFAYIPLACAHFRRNDRAYVVVAPPTSHAYRFLPPCCRHRRGRLGARAARAPPARSKCKAGLLRKDGSTKTPFTPAVSLRCSAPRGCSAQRGGRRAAAAYASLPNSTALVSLSFSPH